MQLIHTMKLSLTISIVILLVIGFLLPGNIIAIDINEDDGIWTDSFDQAGTLDFHSYTSSCVRTTDGTIQLTSTTASQWTYNFADVSNAHKAYYSEFFDIDHILFSFLFPEITGESTFHEKFQLPAIQKHDNVYTDPTSTQGMKNYVVHHFRMKLQGNADDIGNLTISWYGKTQNATITEMFYLNYGKLYSTWKQIVSTKNSGVISFIYTLSHDKLEQAIGSDNYIDVCILATKKSFGKPECMLSTDYIELKSIQQKGYKIGYASAETRDPIDLNALRSNAYWESLTWDDFETKEATIHYQILYYNGSAYVPIKNSTLKGNEGKGFTSSPISLISLTASNYTNIKIRATLETKDPSVTPKIFSWSLTYQSLNRWQDLFSSEYRIDQKDNINVQNGIGISLTSGDWPMFGQNPANTRTSTGKAVYKGDYYWWSDYPKNLNQTIGGLVVDSSALYVSVINPATNKGSLYKYSPFVVESDEIGWSYPYTIKSFSYLNTQGNTIIGSPAISDSYIIVATGDEDTSNYVYAFDKDTPSKEPIWIYGPSDPEICYRGSPIIAEGKIFLTSSSTDQTNNMIIVLDISNGERIWNYTFPTSSYPLLSPTWSYSTPAYSEGKIVVGYGCASNKSDNLFAFESNGNLLWNISIGAIGRASPVIYNNTVYIINEETIIDGIRKQTKVTAIDIQDGNIKWQTKLGRPLTTILNADLTDCLAQSTPAIANNVLYATSPDYNVTALDLSRNGSILWNQKVYSELLPPSTPILASSPAYAGGILYISTPEGYLYALNTSTKGNVIWRQQTFPYDLNIPISTDPIVTNSLVFFGAEDGRLYVFGHYTAPSEQISGSFTSIPIQLPEGKGWNKFQVVVKTNPNINLNKITFSLLDANKTVFKNIQNGSVLSSDTTLGSTLRLHADLWAKNISLNPTLVSWSVTFFNKTIDKIKPFINISTLTPNLENWVNKIIPQFTVKVKDNNSGLRVNSARYTLGYYENNQTVLKSFTGQCQCTGINGTNSVEQITINISKLTFYKNITSLRSLRINITDIAGNTATQYRLVKEDITKPTSFLNNQQSIKSRYNASTKFIWINASSFDNGTDASGIKQVQLYYRNSSTGIFNGPWINFSSSSKKSPTWRFNFTGKNQNGGYFEICTIATDNAGNLETFPTKGDVSFIYDWTIPDLPIFSGETVWFKEPSTFSIVFKDDFRLDTIQYQLNFENSWTTIAAHINASTYDEPWSLNEEYWNQMNEGEFYNLYFKINDTLGNTRLVTSNNQAITIRKDTSPPIGTINIPSLETETSWSYNFTVSGFVNDQDGSGINEVSLYYRFSKDKSNWSSWTVYEDVIKSSPYKWEFSAPDGEGYYEFKIHVTDIAGNTMESGVFPVVIISFPTTLILVMISLVVVLCLLSAIIFIKYKKTKVT